MPITDAFTGTNGTALPSYSANWVYNTPSGNIQIQSNAFTSNVSAWSCCERTEASFPSDQYAQVTLPVVVSSSFLGATVRCQGAGTSSFYIFVSSSANSYMYEIAGGIESALGSPGGGFANGDVILLSAAGTTLTPNKNGSTTGTPGQQTDATHSNGKPGVGSVADTSLTVRADSFECSDDIPGIPAVSNQFSGTAPLISFSSDTPTRFNV